MTRQELTKRIGYLWGDFEALLYDWKPVIVLTLYALFFIVPWGIDSSDRQESWDARVAEHPDYWTDDEGCGY